jgi:hypothetical protein
MLNPSILKELQKAAISTEHNFNNKLDLILTELKSIQETLKEIKCPSGTG